MKTLIIQVAIGATGYAYTETNPAVLDDFTKYCIPSVKRYCEKYGYEYSMITDWPTDHDPWFFNKSTKPRDYDYSKGGKNKASTLVRYLNMYQHDYDMIVSLDNDIYITDYAPKIPKIKGHAAIEDVGKGWDTMRRTFALPKDKFVNAGVQIVDKNTGKKIYEHFANICDNKIEPPLGYRSDQSYMNHWRSMNHDLSIILNDEWNYFMGDHITGRIENSTGKYFLHYAGKHGRQPLKRDIKKGLVKE